ncbi:hypothetical protein ACUXKL_001941 [Kocuria marina]|uniref:hypothetical protein n=1 Tax=Kocuria marina TaxID=223184 RepID=UPI001C931383|nr:hypothetical protein [Kocuria indica]
MPPGVLRPWSGRGRDAPVPAQGHDRRLQFLGQRADLIRSVPGPLPTMIMGLRALVSASTVVKLGFAREEAGRIRVSDEFLRDG